MTQLCKKCKHYLDKWIMSPDKNHIYRCDVALEKTAIRRSKYEITYDSHLSCPYNSFEEKENDTGR